jgi:DNA polymerase-3 subunit beta
MSGVFQFSTRINICSTDAHKLVKYAQYGCNGSQVADFIMPKKPLTFKKYLGTSDAKVLNIMILNAFSLIIMF